MCETLGVTGNPLIFTNKQGAAGGSRQLSCVCVRIVYLSCRPFPKALACLDLRWCTEGQSDWSATCLLRPVFGWITNIHEHTVQTCISTVVVSQWVTGDLFSGFKVWPLPNRAHRLLT